MEPLRCLAILFLLFTGGLAQSNYIIEYLHIKTANATYAGMNFGSIDLEIITGDFKICVIDKLENGENDFQAGHVDIYERYQLQQCQDLVVPENKFIGKVILTLHGIDNWIPDWVRVVFNDTTYAQCNDGHMMTGGDQHDLTCENVDPGLQ